MRKLLALMVLFCGAAGADADELQRSCVEPPATVIEITGVNTKNAQLALSDLAQLTLLICRGLLVRRDANVDCRSGFLAGINLRVLSG
jgi:hypothetical protein